VTQALNSWKATLQIAGMGFYVAFCVAFCVNRGMQQNEHVVVRSGNRKVWINVNCSDRCHAQKYCEMGVKMNVNACLHVQWVYHLRSGEVRGSDCVHDQG